MNFENIGLKDFGNYLKTTDFFTAPASTKYHGAREGGLWRHSQTVADLLVKWTIALGIEWQSFTSPMLIGLCHDVCKIGLYEKTEDGYKHKPNRDLDKHGSLSVEILESYGVHLTDEERYCIHYHMGEYTKDGQLTYSEALQRCPNLIWVHTADMYASQILGR